MNDKKINLHIGLFVEPYLSLILNGKKTIESRFSKVKIIPFNSVELGDFILLKKSSGPIYGVIEAGKIHNFYVVPNTMWLIKDKFGKELCLTEEFWEHKKNSKYATLIEIASIIKFENPIEFKIHKNRQSWIIFKKQITQPNNFQTYIQGGNHI